MPQSYISELLVSSKRKRILDDFAETTSAHGCILASKSQNAFMRILWITAILSAWLVINNYVFIAKIFSRSKNFYEMIYRIICTYQIWISIDKYYQYQTVVSIQIRHMTNSIFPAVTICNLNPIRASWLKTFFSQTSNNETEKSDNVSVK
ncbi:unnamed protein product [Brugia timori]|uniref:Bm6918, isoform b n=2 Tax=Brugia TaxID=6278 RepID=A0A1I9G1Q4_BRUMA|nr:Bm6918, isoform b [Brugia malayi]VDO57619.1 unnamed protein product [Brugia timori]